MQRARIGKRYRLDRAEISHARILQQQLGVYESHSGTATC